LSGYNAIAVKAGENIKINPDDPLEFDLIEIEATAQPGGGPIDVEVNGKRRGSPWPASGKRRAIFAEKYALSR
jgi:hypothetical protein